MSAVQDAHIHHLLLDAIVRTGHGPTRDELAAGAGVARADVEASLRRLGDAHGVVLHPGTCDVWIAHPFALSPTTTWVEASARGFWAPCVWCAFGILALVGDGDVHARAGGEARPIVLRVRAGRLAGDDGMIAIHFALPPRAAWDNVVHWCASVQPFISADDVPVWCARHGYTPGAVVPAANVLELGRAWYGRHLAIDWRKHTTAEAAAIFAAVGLTGKFWALPAGDERF